MKKRIYSWMLAGAYLVWGIVLFLAVAKFQELVSGFNISAPFIMRVIFAIGPYGCLLVAVAMSVGLILNDLRFHARFVNMFFTFTFLLWVMVWVYCMATFANAYFFRQMT